MNNEFKKIEGAEFLKKLTNTTNTDYKAEVIAANFIEDGYDPEKIFLIRKGSARRGFSKDIEDIQLSQYDDLLYYLHLYTNREGVYDILPEGMFHQPINKKFNKDKEDILEEIRTHQKEEFFARRFFQLFEVEIDSALINAYLYEIKYDKKVSNRNFVDIFVPYWPILKQLKREQAILFMSIIPVLHKIRNNYPEIEKAMSLILEVPVHIKPIKLPAKKASRHYASKLGECRLDVDFVLGKTFDDGKYDLKVTIGPITSKEMENFIETALGNTILNKLFDLFIPADVFIVKEFKIVSKDAKFKLSDEHHTSFLGINTFI